MPRSAYNNWDLVGYYNYLANITTSLENLIKHSTPSFYLISNRSFTSHRTFLRLLLSQITFSILYQIEYPLCDGSYRNLRVALLASSNSLYHFLTEVMLEQVEVVRLGLRTLRLCTSLLIILSHRFCPYVLLTAKIFCYLYLRISKNAHFETCKQHKPHGKGYL